MAKLVENKGGNFPFEHEVDALDHEAQFPSGMIVVMIVIGVVSIPSVFGIRYLEDEPFDPHLFGHIQIASGDGVSPGEDVFKNQGRSAVLWCSERSDDSLIRQEVLHSLGVGRKGEPISRSYAEPLVPKQLPFAPCAEDSLGGAHRDKTQRRRGTKEVFSALGARGG